VPVPFAVSVPAELPRVLLQVQQHLMLAVLGVRGPRVAIPAVSVARVWDTPASVAVDSDSELCAVRLDL